MTSAPTSSPTSVLTTSRTNECKMFENVLLPGDSLKRGQFLCYGDLRFGIDADRGRFLVGFINRTAALFSNDDDDDEDSERSERGNVTPDLEAWRAVPNALFASADRPFQSVGLSKDGNILGYDSSGMEMYDSNYDYAQRVESKADNSYLIISQDCWDIGRITEEEGVSCVELTSPPMPGMENGMVTWRVHVTPEDIEEVELLSLQPTTSPSSFPSTVPSVVDGSTGPTLSLSPTVTFQLSAPDGVGTVGNNEDELYYDVASSVAVGDAVMSSEVVGYPPASVPSNNPALQNLFLEDDIAEEAPFESAKLEGDNVTETIVAEDASVQFPEEEEDVLDNNNESKSNSIIGGTVWLDSNRNGAIDQWEDPVDDIEVRLYECSNGGNDDNATRIDGNATRRRAQSDDGVVFTDSNGMFFFEVPIGRTYRVQFDVDYEIYGYSSGTHTSPNPLGWTWCETLKTDIHIRWDAGLYLINDTAYIDTASYASPEMAAATTTVIAGHGSLIRGIVYLDVDEDGIMDQNERNTAVGGYTVNDASILVSLTDCGTNYVIDTLDMKFPGTYSFGDLIEGFYKLVYEMRVIIPLNATGVPLYSFVDGNNSTFYETKCGKLGKGEIVNSGNVGLRMEPLQIKPYSSAESDEDSSKRAVTSMQVGADSNAEGGKNSFVPAVVGFLVAITSVTLAAIFFVKRSKLRYLDLSTIPFIGSGKTDIVDGPCDGSSRLEDSSLVSAGQSMQLMMDKSVAANVGGNDSDDSDIVNESYAGLEFSSKKASPFQKRGNSSEMYIGEINEAGSEGYEVYDDEEGSERSDRSVVDYGPVVLGIIANYSEQQSKAQHEQEENYLFGTYEPKGHDMPTCGSFRAADPPAASYKDIPGTNSGAYTDLHHMNVYHEHPMPDNFLAADDSYQWATIEDVPNAHRDNGGLDVCHGPNLDVLNADRERNIQYNSYEERQSVDSDSSSSDSNSSAEEAFKSEWINTSPEGTLSSLNVEKAAAIEADDGTTVISSGSDQSADPPGASYKNIPKSPPLPRRTTPPPRTAPNSSPNPRRSSSSPRTPMKGYLHPPKNAAVIVRQGDTKMFKEPLPTLHVRGGPAPLLHR